MRPMLWMTGGVLLLVGLVATFVAFDSYSNKVANELMNAILRSESASIQQGNLLTSITKLQSSIETSDSLAGVAAFDLNLDPQMRFPLILIGEVSSVQPHLLQSGEIRVGVFAKTYARQITRQHVLVFHFRPKFILWTFAATAISLTLLLSSFGVLGIRLESVRARERALAFEIISQQIAHDIRSPLSALKIFSGVAEGKGLPTQILNDIVDRIEEILEDLKFRAVRPGTATAFSINDAIKRIAREKNLEHPGRTIRTSFNGAGEIVGDQAQFSRAISNLVNNALEASTADSPVEIALNVQRGRCVLSIVDSGRGIPDHLKPSLFKRGVTFGKLHGNGLGLFHAKKVFDELEGEIAVDSKVGLGTKISISLNCRPMVAAR